MLNFRESDTKIEKMIEKKKEKKMVYPLSTCAAIKENLYQDDSNNTKKRLAAAPTI